jgi:hypothetical protein
MANIRKHATAAKKYRLNCLRITAARSTVVVGRLRQAGSITSRNVDKGKRSKVQNKSIWSEIGNYYKNKNRSEICEMILHMH